jgi:hypothetical protein
MRWERTWKSELLLYIPDKKKNRIVKTYREVVSRQGSKDREPEQKDKTQTNYSPPLLFSHRYTKTQGKSMI